MQSARSWSSSLVSERRPKRGASSRSGGAPTASRTFFPEVERARWYYVQQNMLFVTLAFLLLGVVARATAKDGDEVSLWDTARSVGTELWDLAFGVDWPGQPRRQGLRYFLSAEYWSAALFGANPMGSTGSVFNSQARGLPPQPRMGLLPALAHGLYNSLPRARTVWDALLRAAVVTAGCYVFRWGVKVGGGVPKLWELRLALRKLVSEMEGKPMESAPAAKAQPSGAASPVRKAAPRPTRK